VSLLPQRIRAYIDGSRWPRFAYLGDVGIVSRAGLPVRLAYPLRDGPTDVLCHHGRAGSGAPAPQPRCSICHQPLSPVLAQLGHHDESLPPWARP
jgi:hypothetical protein